MVAELNHTIVHCTDKAVRRASSSTCWRSAAHAYGPFLVVKLGNGVSLDYADDHGQPAPQHYAFLVSEEEFDEIPRASSTAAWPSGQTRSTVAGEINTNDGGRGLYWDDPDGHSLEIITVPYGGWLSAPGPVDDDGPFLPSLRRLACYSGQPGRLRRGVRRASTSWVCRGRPGRAARPGGVHGRGR